MNDSQIAEYLYNDLRSNSDPDWDMGNIEKAINSRLQGICRQVLKRMTQDAADRAEMGCPGCGDALKVVGRARGRSVNSVFGVFSFTRGYGFCERCRSHAFPADASLGLMSGGRASPRLQEICSLTVLRGPAGATAEDVERITGINVSASTLHREARRQDERAVAIRDREVRLAKSPQGKAVLETRRSPVPPGGVLVIEIDAWNIRERDYWGETQKRQENEEETGRWHWVYTGTVFRLAHRGKTENGRTVITERGYVATRAGLEAFSEQLYAEAIQHGLRYAETVLILGDGAVWIWNLADNLFKGAKQRVDLFHVKEHLWALAADLHGKGTPEAEEWLRPYLRWLEKRKHGALDIINSLEELRDSMQDKGKREALDSELGYMKRHSERMDYKRARTVGQPCGSGAIESTCAQYQRRFKLTGQFWSLEGDEALLALATLHRNGRWSQLFAHDEH
jgi:hypothetical protein